MEQEKRDSVKSLGKALHLIDIINQARTPMTLMSLSQVSGFPKSTVYALLNTLRSYDCIRQGSDGRYYLGTRLFEWGCGVSASWELNNVARPYLEKLAAHTDATALLSRIEGNSVVVIDQSTAMCGGIYVTTEIGTHLPLHATSQGKLLAAMSDASAKAFLSGAGQLESFTPHTIVEQESILRELGQIRANGYAVENGEYKIGLRSVSAPVYDRCGVMSYALSVVDCSARCALRNLRKWWPASAPRHGSCRRPSATVATARRCPERDRNNDNTNQNYRAAAGGRESERPAERTGCAAAVRTADGYCLKQKIPQCGTKIPLCGVRRVDGIR